MELNPSQLRAISHGSGPCLILAGPGSGKTTVIIRRIQNLISEHRVRPEHILAVTFSRAAADEMSQRFSGPSGVTFGTVHSIFLKILKEDLHGGLSVISGKDSADFMKHEITKYSVPCRSSENMSRDLLLAVSRMKSGSSQNNAVYLKQSLHIPSDLFLRIFSDYQLFLKERSLFDFDDIINECYRLLKKSPAVLSKWQEKYRYILADEFQDLSLLQYNTLRLLAGSRGNIFAVGDDDQSIYGFRGAGSGIMRRFMNEFPEACQILLDVNYRCPSAILTASQNIISENTDRFEKKLIPARSGGIMELKSYATRRDEYRAITLKISQLALAGKDVAVLFRSNYDSYMFIKLLQKEGLRFECRENTVSLSDHFAARDILSYLRTASALASRSSLPIREDLLHILNRPERYINRDSLRGALSKDMASCFDSMVSFYRHDPVMLAEVEKLRSEFLLIAGLSPFAAIQYVRNVAGYDRWLFSFARDKQLDIDELTESLDTFSEYASLFNSIDELLADVKRPSNGLSIATPPMDDQQGRISVLTMHASKGMEFDAVFIPDVIEGIIPTKNSVKEGTVNEERRLFYVAMTRAREELHISWVREYRFKEAVVSRLLPYDR